MSEGCQRILSRRHDLAQIEESKVPMEIQSLQKMPANKSSPNPCYGCGGQHFQNVYTVKSMDTQKNSASGVVIEEVINWKIRNVFAVKGIDSEKFCKRG